MTELITAIGLVLVIEGLAYGAFPGLGKRLARLLDDTPPETLRMTGLITAAIGLGIVWLVRG